MTIVMSSMAGRPETQVTEKAKRRKYTAEFKARILREAEACTKPGELGALLRREGLYSSHVSVWRAQAMRAQLEGLGPKKRGPKPKEVDARDKKIAQLERELGKATKRAERAEALVELQKKVAQLMGRVLPEPDEETR